MRLSFGSIHGACPAVLQRKHGHGDRNAGNANDSIDYRIVSHALAPAVLFEKFVDDRAFRREQIPGLEPAHDTRTADWISRNFINMTRKRTGSAIFVTSGGRACGDTQISESARAKQLTIKSRNVDFIPPISLTCHILERRFFAAADKMGVEGYHNYTTGLRL